MLHGSDESISSGFTARHRFVSHALGADLTSLCRRSVRVGTGSRSCPSVSTSAASRIDRLRMGSVRCAAVNEHTRVGHSPEMCGADFALATAKRIWLLSSKDALWRDVLRAEA
jgi:hypothetical protein